MIVKMTKYTWILLSGMKDGFLGRIRELGVVDITRSDKPVDSRSEELLSRIEESKALVRDLENGTDRHLEDLLSEYDELERKREAAEIWGQFSVEDLSVLKENGVRIDFYSVADKTFDQAWQEEWPLEIIGRKGGRTYFVVAGAEGFPAGPVPAPEHSAHYYREEAGRKLDEIKAYRSELESRKSEIPELKAYVSDKTVELDTYLAGLNGEEMLENHLVVYEGFAPSTETLRLCQEFDGMDLYYIHQDAAAEDNPPIELKNNRFVRMFEVLTDMYGRPAYDSFDPTPFISIFFLLFFAMCMGDMGYGLVLVIAGFLLKKVRSFASLAPLVTWLGIGTMVVGFCFHTFFSIDFIGCAWIPGWAKTVMVPAKIAGYDGTMILALLIGIIHLCLAMIVKTVNATRHKGFLESLGTWGWTTLIVGAVAVGAAALAGILDKTATRLILICLGVVCAIGIFPFNNIHRKPLTNVGSGLWDTYNMATGLLGDVLSYLRLYALGLAGAMLGFAFNDMAKMALGDGGAVRWIAFILIVIVGHTLNLAMAALGAFVHPLRLNFLEFFKNSDYDASGRKYRPVSKSNNINQ